MTTNTLPGYTGFGAKNSNAVVTVTNKHGGQRSFTLTQAQEDAAQAMAKGQFVSMARRSGKNLVRQRVLDLLKAGGVTVKTPAGQTATGTKAKSPTVFTLVRELVGDDTEVVGIFSSKTSAKSAAQVDYVKLNTEAGVDVDADEFEGDLSTEWINDKNNSRSQALEIGVGTMSATEVVYTITGKTLRK